MTSLKKKIIAVGYTVKYTEEIFELLNELGIEKRKLPTEMHVGIWFSENAPKITKENTKSDADMQAWYNKKKRQGDSFSGSINSLYVSGNKRIVVAMMNCNGVRALSFLYNELSISTSVIKKAINSGNLQSQNLEKRSIPEKIKLTMVPYILEI